MIYLEDEELIKRILVHNSIELGAKLNVHRLVQNFIIETNPVIQTINDKTRLAKKPIIWVYWAQGNIKMPPMVKTCFDQLNRTNADSDVIFIHDDNLNNYINIPGYIYDKLSTDKTHFSDVLRVALLAEHGGIWVDATCYCSGNVSILFPTVESESGFFAFHGDKSYITLLSNWFLASRPGDVISVLLRDALYYYWLKQTSLEHYFLFHFMFEALYNLVDEFRKNWDASLILYNKYPHLFQQILFEQFDLGIWKKIMGVSMIHKLTYKYDQNKEYHGTYLSYIINQKGGD